MSFKLTDFETQAELIIGIFSKLPTLATEVNTIRIALGADATTRDTTRQTPPASTGLKPGHHGNTPFANRLLRLVNRGKGGNLTTIQMANILGGLVMSPPINTAPPTITYASGGAGAGTQPGAVYASGAGTWNPNTGNTRTNQWLRNGTNIAGQTGTTYTTVAADAGTSISIRVTMANAAGSNSAVSNSAAIT